MPPIAIEGEYQRRFALGRLKYFQQCNGEGLMAVLSLADWSDCANKALKGFVLVGERS